MTNHLPSEIDITIIGGGPAGAATALSLQKKGAKSIAIWEKSPQDDFRVGETISPNTQSILQELGVLDSFLKDGHLPSDGSSSAWGSNQLGYNDFFLYPDRKGWHLNRSRFDASLAQWAADGGAFLMRETKVIRWEKLPDGTWLLTLRSKHRGEFHVKTSFVVDATGRRSLFAVRQGVKPVRIDQLIGVACVFTFDKDVPRNYHTLVEATELGWWYAACLPNQRVIVTLMSDRQLLRQQGLLKFPHWREYLQKTQYVQELITQASCQSQLLIQPAYSQYLDRIVGDGWLAVGDAACTFDPLSSSGIHKALLSGIKAAEAIANYFNGNSQALSTYESQTLRQFELYLEDRRKYYALESRWHNSPFWQSRRGGITLDPSQHLIFQESPPITKNLRRLDMYLPAKDLHLLCNLCNSGNIASDVVSQFLSQTHHQVSAYRVIETLQYLLEKKVLSASL